MAEASETELWVDYTTMGSKREIFKKEVGDPTGCKSRSAGESATTLLASGGGDIDLREGERVQRSDPTGSRTLVSGMRTQCPGPLDDGASSKQAPLIRIRYRSFFSALLFLLSKSLKDFG